MTQHKPVARIEAPAETEDREVRWQVASSSIPAIDSATIDATVAAMSHDRTARSYASRPVHATGTDNGVSFGHERNKHAE
jgi:hypothetical protein